MDLIVGTLGENLLKNTTLDDENGWKTSSSAPVKYSTITHSGKKSIKLSKSTNGGMRRVSKTFLVNDEVRTVA